MEVGSPVPGKAANGNAICGQLADIARLCRGWVSQSQPTPVKAAATQAFLLLHIGASLAGSSEWQA